MTVPTVTTTDTPAGAGFVVTDPPAAPAPAAAPAFDEDAFLKSPAVLALLEQARKQEKDKLYPQIEELKGSVKSLSEQRAEEIAAAEKAAAEKAKADAQKIFEETTAKDLLKGESEKWEQRFAQMEAEREAERARFAKEQEFTQLSSYTRDLVNTAVNNNDVAPELAGFISGNTVEEVNASLEKAKAASAQIVQSAMAAMQQQVPAPAAPRGVAPTGYAPNGPLETAESTRTLSAQDIANMSMSEYAQYRSQFLGTGATQSRSRGLFG